jgi:hypothetical protein
MKLASVDWRYTLQDTLWPALSVTLAVVVLVASQWFVDVQQYSYSQYSSNHHAMNEDYDALLYRKRLVNRYYQRYEYFHEQGFVGSENRLDSIETLRVIATQLGLPNMSYSLEPQREVVVPVGQMGGDSTISINQSTFELEIGLLHELDLLRFISRLRSAVPGLLKIDRCRLTRQSVNSELSATDTNILANCSFVMFSVITADVSEGVAAL